VQASPPSRLAHTPRPPGYAKPSRPSVSIEHEVWAYLLSAWRGGEEGSAAFRGARAMAQAEGETRRRVSAMLWLQVLVCIRALRGLRRVLLGGENQGPSLLETTRLLRTLAALEVRWVPCVSWSRVSASFRQRDHEMTLVSMYRGKKPKEWSTKPRCSC
jgi:hypothetical protein